MNKRMSTSPQFKPKDLMAPSGRQEFNKLIRFYIYAHDLIKANGEDTQNTDLSISIKW